MGSYHQPELLFMIDIESLDLGPRPVITSIGIVAVSSNDPEVPIREIKLFLPVDPQLNLKRTVSAGTLNVWFKQSDSLRADFENCLSDDFEELPATLRTMNRMIVEIIGDAGERYEVMSRGPQFDIAAIESLLFDCGLKPAWRYDKIRDLRTLMASAGLRTQDVPRDTIQFPEHDPIADCMYQLVCYAESQKQLRARV